MNRRSNEQTYHMCVFNMACAGACVCDRTIFPSQPTCGDREDFLKHKDQAAIEPVFLDLQITDTKLYLSDIINDKALISFLTNLSQEWIKYYVLVKESNKGKVRNRATKLNNVMQFVIKNFVRQST